MSKFMHIVMVVAVVLGGWVQSQAATPSPESHQTEAELIAVLKADSTVKQKADACRMLARIGTGESVAPLAALLGDEKLSHMARYGLETIPDPAVDEALRAALGSVTGPQLIGVVGSVGVRRDRRAVEALTGLLKQPDVPVAQAAARSLGKIGSPAAASALRAALSSAPDSVRPAVYEGLFRCAENLVARGIRQRRQRSTDMGIAIYEQLLALPGSHQVRAGALRGAILARKENGLALLKEHLKNEDYILFSAAVQAAQEMPYISVTEVLTEGMAGLPADNQILVILALGKRADQAVLPQLFDLAKSGDRSVRLAAISALPELENPKALPILEELKDDPDSEISRAAQDSLAALSGTP